MKLDVLGRKNPALDIMLWKHKPSLVRSEHESLAHFVLYATF